MSGRLHVLGLIDALAAGGAHGGTSAAEVRRIKADLSEQTRGAGPHA